LIPKLSPARTVGFATLAANVVVAVALTSCDGGGGDANAQTTITIRPTAYVTLPIVTTTNAGILTGTGEGQTPAARIPERAGDVYRVRSGDALPLIADRFGISVDDLVELNDWPEGPLHPIYPGDEVFIPEAADAPATDVVTDERPDDGLGTMPDPGGGPLCPDGTERDLYEIVSGDFISRVSEKNDISIAELEAVNVDNPAYESFVPGQELWLPCEDEELGTVPGTIG
jgi:LysM repeat protein